MNETGSKAEELLNIFKVAHAQDPKSVITLPVAELLPLIERLLQLEKIVVEPRRRPTRTFRNSTRARF